MGWIHGCLWHCHRPEDGCLKRNQQWATDNTKNFVGENFSTVTKRFQQQQKILKEKYGIGYESQHIMWECQWQHLKEGPLQDMSPAEHGEALIIREFMQNHYQPRPLKRLAPRDALRLVNQCSHCLF